MMKKMLPKMLPLLAAVLLLTEAAWAQAQAPAAVEMADAMRADGKIWVVAGVFAIVTLGTLAYLFRLESQVTRLEKRLNDERDRRAA